MSFFILYIYYTIFFYKNQIFWFLVAPVGVEPTTLGSSIQRSTNWATEPYGWTGKNRTYSTLRLYRKQSFFHKAVQYGGGSGIWTHAAVTCPNALAERPLQPNLSIPPKKRRIKCRPHSLPNAWLLVSRPVLQIAHHICALLRGLMRTIMAANNVPRKLSTTAKVE